MDEAKQIIEVNGVKLEVDMRHARRIEELRVGSRVKVLTKTYSGAEVNPGVVVGFEPFPSKPTIIIAYVKAGYSDVGLHTLSYNADTKDVEIVASIDDDFSVSKTEVLGWFDRERTKLANQASELEAKQQFFLDRFQNYWRDEPLADQLQKDGLEVA